MSEVSPGEVGSNHEQSTNGPVKEASTGFMKDQKGSLDGDLANLGLPLLILAGGSAGAVSKFLSEGKVTEAVVSGVVGAAVTLGFAIWAGRHERELDTQSATLKEKFAKGAEQETSQDGQEPKA